MVRALVGAAAIAFIACSRAPAAPAPTPAPSNPPASVSAVRPASPSLSTPSPPPELVLPPASSVYMGRRLATPMSFRGADWLERTDRETTEQPEHVLDVIGFRPGDTVADVGAGSGYFTERIAKRLAALDAKAVVGTDGGRPGPGRVIATDLQPEMLAMIRKRVAALEKVSSMNGIAKVETRLATETDSALPPGAVDVALMVDVYHELPRPDLTLAQVKAALRPEGRLVLVEYRAEDPRVPIKPEHKMTLPQIKRELDAASFAITRVDESLPQQRIVIAQARR